MIPAEAGIDESDELPGHLIAQAKDMGRYGYALPAEYGGLGLSVPQQVGVAIELLRATCAEIAAHAAQREACYQAVDPGGLARTLPGLAKVGGPALAATMGDPARFSRGKRFRSYTGLAPKASETGGTDRKGQPMSKAGSSLLRTTLVRAADHARKQDPSSQPSTTSR